MKKVFLGLTLLVMVNVTHGQQKEQKKNKPMEFPMTEKHWATIKRIYAQQHSMFHTGERPKGRIVSIHKDYLRPIVRGKEIKKVEFGA